MTTSEIARLFNVPESMINSNLNKYNSNAAENLHFLQYTLSPIISAFESALDKSLLLESEKKKMVTISVLMLQRFSEERQKNKLKPLDKLLKRNIKY